MRRDREWRAVERRWSAEYDDHSKRRPCTVCIAVELFEVYELPMDARLNEIMNLVYCRSSRSDRTAWSIERQSLRPAIRCNCGSPPSGRLFACWGS